MLGGGLLNIMSNSVSVQLKHISFFLSTVTLEVLAVSCATELCLTVVSPAILSHAVNNTGNIVNTIWYIMQVVLVPMLQGFLQGIR